MGELYFSISILGGICLLIWLALKLSSISNRPDMEEQNRNDILEHAMLIASLQVITSNDNSIINVPKLTKSSNCLKKCSVV